MMISDQTETEVACTDRNTEKAEGKTAEEETVLLGIESEVNETVFCQKTMAVLYKTATMLFFCGTFSYFMANEPEPLSVLEALTYQGLVLLCFHSISALLDEGIPAMQGVTSVLRDVSFPVAVFISLLSWGLLIPVDEGGLATFKNHFFHTINSLSVVLGMMIVPQAWCKYRCPLPLIYGLAYLGLQIGLQASGQPARYPFLDFKNDPELAGVILFVSVLLLPSIHLILCLLSKLSCRKCPPCHTGSERAGKQE